jgi:hypothetical protein
VPYFSGAVGEEQIAKYSSLVNTESQAEIIPIEPARVMPGREIELINGLWIAE